MTHIDLHGQTAIVTGAARGLGLTVAEELAREGVKVCGSDVRGDDLEAEMDRISRQHGVETLAITADVGDEAQVMDMVGQAYTAWGRVDILVNNAGIREVGPVYETSGDAWERMHAANLKGQFLCTREVLRQGMLERNEGVIVFVSSGSGIQGEKGSSAYCASKFGVTGLAQSVAKDLKDTRIRASAIMPGMVWTPMAQESEMADHDVPWLDPQQVANAILFCIKQDPDTVIPELRIFHRFQI